MEIKLTYLDAHNQQPRTVVVNTPVAIGYDITLMPRQIEGVAVFHLFILNRSLNPYHALITEWQGKLKVLDIKSNQEIPVSQNCFILGRVKITAEQLASEPQINDYGHHRCQKMVGFLFKRPCDRLDSTDCPYCHGGNQFDNYESDYDYYQDYGEYNTWGYQYYRDRDLYYYDADNRCVEFTEADNIAFEEECDRDFEQDFSAS